jgi:hypothetical protein
LRSKRPSSEVLPEETLRQEPKPDNLCYLNLGWRVKGNLQGQPKVLASVQRFRTVRRKTFSRTSLQFGQQIRQLEEKGKNPQIQVFGIFDLEVAFLHFELCEPSAFGTAIGDSE